MRGKQEYIRGVARRGDWRGVSTPGLLFLRPRDYWNKNRKSKEME